MGEVRAGQDLRLQREVAVKLLHPDLAVQPMVCKRFEAEARSAARLVHPNVVAVFDSGHDRGVPFLVMERLPGRTLADAIDEGPMDPGTVRRMATQVLDALAAAHGAGLVHRDIKPANLLVAGPDAWKVGDFGIAKSVSTIDPSLTATGLVIGTPAYLAPERLAGGQATPSGDLYALGIILHEALIGDRVKQGDVAPPVSPASRLPPLESRRPPLPCDLIEVVQRATAPDPANRFSSAQEMSAALGAHAPLAATAPAALGPPVGVTATRILRPIATGSWARRVKRPLRRRRPVAWTVAIGLLFVAVVGTAWLANHRSTSSPTTQISSTAPSSPPAGAPTTSMPTPLFDALQELERLVRP
jgi:serine/threonine protein kinase